MAKGSRGGRRGGGAQAPGVAPQAKAASGSGSGGKISFGKMSDSDAAQLRNDVDDRYDADVTDAIKLYISDSNPNGDGFSHSQNLNYKLDNGLPLNATEQFIDENIQAGMHDIGKNVTIERFCHDDILQQLGVSNYSRMTQQQLNSSLVGTEFATTAYTSFAYDSSKNPFRPGAIGGGGREVTLKFNAKSDTKIVFGAKKQAEMIVNKGTKMKITNIYYDGTYATPRSKGTMPRVVVEVESA